MSGMGLMGDPCENGCKCRSKELVTRDLLCGVLVCVGKHLPDDYNTSTSTRIRSEKSQSCSCIGSNMCREKILRRSAYFDTLNIQVSEPICKPADQLIQPTPTPITRQQ